ncbi:hypothetical protein TCAL_15418, partial [Tigriopus californicus]
MPLLRFQGDCEIEEGLVMNLRNTQEIQKTIPLIQENRDTNNSEVDTMLLAENLISVLKTERDAKQILVILRNRNDPMIVEKMKMVEDVKFYGISYVIKETKIGVNRDSGLSSFANFSTLNYSKFRYSHDSKSVASYASYWEFQNYDLNKWREKLERASSIKQYSLVVQESPNKDTNYPLLLWLEMSDEWCSCYALDLDGQFPGNDHHPLNSLTNWDTAEIVELTFHHEMREWKVWKHILKAEILYSHRLNLQLNTKHDSANSNVVSKAISKAVLQSYTSNPQFQYWNEIDHLVDWLLPRLNTPVINFLITWQFPYYEFKETTQFASEPQEVAQLRKELKKLFRYRNHPSKLNVPLLLLLWENDTFSRFRASLKKYFPHFAEESWYSEFASTEEQCQTKHQNIMETLSKNSIYRQSEKEDIKQLIRIPRQSTAVFADALIFMA